MNEAWSVLVQVGPSVLSSLLAIGLWTDYAWGALLAYRRTRSRGVLREYVVALTGLAATLALSVAVLAALTNPQASPLTVWSIGAARAILLIVGVWLAWDRRVRP